MPNRIIHTQHTGRWYNGLAGLRGVAILMVLLSHNFGFLSKQLEFWGQFGVDVFFVLSGFLISEILLESVGKEHYFHNFYIKRIFRILPVYFLVTIVGLAIARILPEFHPDFNYYIDNIWYLILYFQNWLKVFNPPELKGGGIFGHYWTLGIEEQFYFIFPLVVFLFRNRIRLIVYLLFLFIIMLIAFRYFFWLNLKNPLDIYNAPFKTRYDGIAVGALLAIFKNSTYSKLRRLLKNCLIGFLVCHAVIFVFIRVEKLIIPHFLIIGFTSLVLIIAIIVWYSLNEHTIIYKLLNNRFLSFFAEISYGLYLIHAIVLSFLEPYFEQRYPAFTFLPWFLFGVSVTGISTLLSYWSFRYFESPILRKNKFVK